MKQLIGVLLGVGLIVVMFLVLRGSAPKTRATNVPRVAANVIIEEPGRYRSLTGDYFVDIWEEEEGKLKYRFYRQRIKGLDGGDGGGPAKSFRPESDWFVCWDSQNRLWAYVPELDQRRCSCLYANEEATGICRAGDLGGWEGIPPSFFGRLPDEVKETYRQYKSSQTSGNSEQDAETDG